MSFEKEPRSVNKKPKEPTLTPCIIKQESTTKPPNASSIDNIAVNASLSGNAPAPIDDVEASSKKKDSAIDENEKKNNDDDKYLDSFPPGYRFCPLDEELVLYYLKKRVLNETLPHNRIMEVNLYHHNPEYLAGTCFNLKFY